MQSETTKLNQYLSEHGISKSELARETGLDLRTISAMCRGTREGNLYSWKLVASALGCKLDEIIEV